MCFVIFRALLCIPSLFSFVRRKKCTSEPAVFKPNTFDLKKSSTKVMYLSFCLLGGIMTSTRISRRMKLLWVFVNLVTAGFTCVSTLLYIYRIGKIDVNAATFFHVMTAIHGVGYRFFAMGVAHYCRNDIEKVIQIMDRNFKHGNESENDRMVEERKMDTSFTMTPLILILIVLMVTYLSSRPLHAIFIAHGVGVVNNLFYYLIPFPYLDKTDSLQVYLVISLVHILVSLPEYTVYLFFSTFTTSITFEFYNEFRLLKRNIKRSSQLLKVEDRDHIHANVSPGGHYPRRKNIQMFESKIIECIRHHQDLVE